MIGYKKADGHGATELPAGASRAGMRGRPGWGPEYILSGLALVLPALAFTVAALIVYPPAAAAMAPVALGLASLGLGLVLIGIVGRRA